MATVLGANTLSSGFDVGNSLRQNRADSSFLSKTFDDDGTHHDKGTISVWVKRSQLGAEAMIYSAGASGREFIRFETNDTLTYRSLASSFHLNTNRVFRDPSAWYHIVVAFDSSQGTASNRQKIYVNGVQETSFATETYQPNQNTDHKILSGELQRLGRDSEQANPFANCYFCEVVGIDGVAHAPTSFGEFDSDSGIWKPIKVSGLTFGTNGFHLNFADSSALGTDVSGNGNDFANTNFAAIDQTTDTCTNNFATLNPLYPTGGGYDNQSGATFTEGATIFTTDNGDADWGFCSSSILVASGKWYVEVKYVSTDNGSAMIGIRSTPSNNDNAYIGRLANGVSYMANGDGDGDKKVAATQSAYATEGYAAGDIIGVALDLDNNKIYFSKNGTFVNSGDPTSGSTGTGAIAVTAAASTVMGGYLIGASEVNSNGNAVFNFNFGNPSFSISSSNADGSGFGNFEYAVPSGYFALCSKNLAGNS